jgi:hypothetical protein
MDGYRIAESFFFYNDIFNALSILVSFAISWLAFRVYRLTKQRKTVMFSLAFLLIGISYCFLFSPFILHLMSEAPPGPPPLPFSLPMPFFILSVLYLVGVALLLSTTLKTWQVSIPLTLFLLSAVGLFMAPNPLIGLHVFSTVLFAFITLHYLINYLKHKDVSRLTVFIGFLCLLVGNAVLIFTRRDTLFFTLGRIVELGGYIAFLIDLLLVLRR